MLSVLRTRFKQGYRTIGYPKQEPEMPDRFRGRPAIDARLCMPDCRQCLDACPTGAIFNADSPMPRIDLGRCLFCPVCTASCPAGAIGYTTDYRLAASRRDHLMVGASDQAPPACSALSKHTRRLFGRSLRLRQVSAGGCGACEADTNVLSTITYDLGRFGIQFVASPRHADGLLITGPVTENMRTALLKAWKAVPSPKIVIALGACAISGGPFSGLPQVHDGPEGLVPIDLYIPGCPPHPMTTLDGLLRLLGRLQA
jgi:Ni,Fe-hydrogenase III small subunit/Pyruvate/2-oxoacid:ferredoxin oxidoreductase delta subunit